jgi:hypothetical protein
MEAKKTKLGRPVVFIGSSKEQLEIARTIQAELYSDEIEAVVWPPLFQPGDSILETLDRQANNFDFAILVLNGDDSLQSRGGTEKAPRDNIIFELGLCVGKLGRDRCFYIFKSNERPKIPSDLAGVIPIKYNEPGSFGLNHAIAAACNEIRNIIFTKGPKLESITYPEARIDFSYLPELSVEKRGWKLGQDSHGGKLPLVTVLDDQRFGRCLMLKAPEGYMDFELTSPILANTVQLLVKGDG